MSVLRPLLVCVLSALPSWSATFGTVVAHPQSLADLVLDEARKRIYLVDTYSNQVDVYSTASNPPALVTTINTDATPLAVAISRSGKSLYVACYTASTLDIFDLTSAAFSKTSVSLGANPEGVAVGYNELVLISTIGTGTGQAVLTTYNPSASGSSALQALVVAPTAPATPQLPPPNGLMYFAGKSQLQATPDGTRIIGVNQQASTRTVFVFDVASSTVLASRTIAATSPILAVSPDGSEFLSGPMLFETSTLLVLAQQNTTNSPFVFAAGANFTTQTNQGGAVFLPDGSELLTAYNIVPVQNPAARPNTSQLLINTPDSLLIQMGVMLPENLGGKIVISSDGATMYAISQSGFVVASTAGLKTSPVAIPDTNVTLLANDQCGVTASQNSAVIPVRNQGGREAHRDGAGVDLGSDFGPGKSGGQELRRRCHRSVQHRGDGARARHRRSRPASDSIRGSHQHHSQRARFPEQSQRRGARRHHPRGYRGQHDGAGRYADRYHAAEALHRQSGEEPD